MLEKHLVLRRRRCPSVGGCAVQLVVREVEGIFDGREEAVAAREHLVDELLIQPPVTAEHGTAARWRTPSKSRRAEGPESDR